MPMEWSRYPLDWARIAREVKDAADWKCQQCGKQCRRPGEPFDTHKNTLTVSHLDHNPENCAPENLRAMCAPCHLVYDKGQHTATRRRNRKKRVCHIGDGVKCPGVMLARNGNIAVKCQKCEWLEWEGVL